MPKIMRFLACEKNAKKPPQRGHARSQGGRSAECAGSAGGFRGVHSSAKVCMQLENHAKNFAEEFMQEFIQEFCQRFSTPRRVRRI